MLQIARISENFDWVKKSDKNEVIKILEEESESNWIAH